MNEKKIELIEKYFDGNADEKERREIERMLADDPEFTDEFKEQQTIIEELNKMKLKDPGVEFWDSYWKTLYNRIERGIAWILISMGAIIIIGFGAVNAIEELINENSLPLLAKIGIYALIVGFVILIVSIVREKLIFRNKDKYRNIER